MDNISEKIKKVPKWVWIAVAAIVVVVVFVRMKSGGGSAAQSLPVQDSGSSPAPDPAANDYGGLISAIGSLAQAQGQAWQSFQQQQADFNSSLLSSMTATNNEKVTDTTAQSAAITPISYVPGGVTVSPTTTFGVDQTGQTHVLTGDATVGSGDAVQNGKVADALFTGIRDAFRSGSGIVPSTPTNTAMTGATSAKPSASSAYSLQQGDNHYQVVGGNIYKNGNMITVSASNKKYIPTDVITAAKTQKAG